MTLILGDTGVGWGMFGVSLFTGTYYNMIIAWCFFYMFASFASDVPWRDCNHYWNSPGNKPRPVGCQSTAFQFSTLLSCRLSDTTDKET